MTDAIAGWGDRLSWSGETPLDYPDLHPVAALRFDQKGPGWTWPDAVDPANTWTAFSATGAGPGAVAGQWGTHLTLNSASPATEQGRVTLPFFPGLWPSAGTLLISMWVRQGYTMAYNPLLSTRGGPSPLVYLSTYQGGSVRQGVYNAAGTLVHDSYETTPWAGTTGWQWIGQLVDFGALITRTAVVEAATGRAFIGPARPLSGPANPASTADLDVFALQTASYWTGGAMDEVLVAHPTAMFDFPAYVERIRRGSWARGGATAAAGKLTVTDTAVTTDAAHTLTTGAEPVSWTLNPEPTVSGAIASWSTDNGSSWQTGALPPALDGLLRWDVPLQPGDEFTGLTLLPPSPALAAIADQTVPQRGTLELPLDGTWSGTASWSVAAAGVTATITDATLHVNVGWASGDIPVTVTLTDPWGRVASSSFTLQVPTEPWTPPLPPRIPRAAIIVGDGDDTVAIIDALSAVITQEVNGEHSLEFQIPVAHPRAGAIVPEAAVELAGERYRVRRITTARQGRTPVQTMYCEALFYDLAYTGQLPPRDYLQTPAGVAMEDALRGTGWGIGAVTVTTRRTYSVEQTNPLAMLRTIQEQHGGDLMFDSAARTVSLVTRSGRDAGVSFFYSRGLTESKRVVDTTSLVTRIVAVNADGLSIASVNGGKPYVEDFTYTAELREATYDFAAGTSAWTMLAMAQATLAARAKPSYSYEFTVADLSYRSGQEVDRFDVGDLVTVIDDDLGIREAQRIIRVEHDVMRPWASKITLSGKLRETGSSSDDTAGALTSGSTFSTFDLVPYNLLRNGRFDNALAHWAGSGVSVVAGEGTGDYAVRFHGDGLRWIEQTVQPDNRDVYALSLDAAAVSGGEVPPLTAIVTVEYEDGTTDVIPVELS